MLVDVCEKKEDLFGSKGIYVPFAEMDGQF
jgi:hypothetical protein